MASLSFKVFGPSVGLSAEEAIGGSEKGVMTSQDAGVTAREALAGFLKVARRWAECALTGFEAELWCPQ